MKALSLLKRTKVWKQKLMLLKACSLIVVTCHLISQQPDKMTAELEDALILLHEKKLSSLQSMVAIAWKLYPIWQAVD